MKLEEQAKDRRISFEQALKELEDCFRETGATKFYAFILSTVEKPLIEKVLDKTEGNQSKAAQILGINRNTLHSKIAKLGIDVKQWKRY